MKQLLAKLIVAIWNRIVTRRARARHGKGLDLGFEVADGQMTSRHLALGPSRRAQHIAILGKTGTGKSSLLRHMCWQDIQEGRGFVYFDLHGDASPFVLAAVAAQERKIGYDLSERLIVVEPADPEFSVGVNFLEQETPDFVHIAEFAEVLKQRWHLEHFGARTDELLRNSLYVLSSKGYTLLELAPFLTQASFRSACLRDLPNAEIEQYFKWRFDQVSEPMRRVMSEPILNKISAFTADPHFRHIVGQPTSTFSLRDAMDRGRWVLVNLDKGRLGEHALTLGSLFLTTIKSALFARRRRELFTLYVDEIQNFVVRDGGLEVVLSEARKFGVAVVSANQFLDQYPADMRSAILAVGTHVFFQLSSTDAQQIGNSLDGGHALGELLKNLPQRQMVVKAGHHRWQEVVVPTLRQPAASYADLLNRCHYRWTRTRQAIDRQIANRQRTIGQQTQEALHDWE